MNHCYYKKLSACLSRLFWGACRRRVDKNRMIFIKFTAFDKLRLTAQRLKPASKIIYMIPT